MGSDGGGPLLEAGRGGLMGSPPRRQHSRLLTASSEALSQGVCFPPLFYQPPGGGRGWMGGTNPPNRPK